MRRKPLTSFWKRLEGLAPAFIGFFMPVAAFADEPASGAKWRVFAECRMVVLSQKAAMPLIVEFGDEKKAEGAWEKVTQMLDSREAHAGGRHHPARS